MSKFNTVTRTGVTSPVKSTAKLVNAAGQTGYARDEKSELFLLAVSNFVGQDTFYETAKNRDDRFANLSRKVAVADPKWFGNFVGWLRNDAFMRSASIVASAEGAKALLDAGKSGKPVRELVAASMARADEPGEFLAYWTAKYGKNLPQSVKKGVGDGAKRLYNQRSLLKYDTESKGFRFADVIQLTHVKSDDATQNDVFQYALNRRFGNTEIPSSLWTIRKNKELMELPVGARKTLIGGAGGIDVQKVLNQAGLTWESLSGWLQGPMDKAAWTAIIPSMGYMALLRNLRNFVEAGVSQEVMNTVLAKLADPAEVAKSKQFPFRFLAAYQANKDNLKIAAALEDALQASLVNVPELKGRTLILVDRSGSMFGFGYGQREELDNADKAAIFGTALALRAENADLVEFGTTSRKVSVRKGDSILTTLKKFSDLGGTNTGAAVQAHFKGHDRVIIVTDEQYTWGRTPSEIVPANVPLYTWNLVGYRAGHGESGTSKRHTFGGLTDKGFQMIPLIEAGQNQVYPWEA